MTIMTKHEYREFTIVEQTDIMGEEYGYSVIVDVAGDEWEFNCVESAKAYLDELLDEMERKAEYQSRLTWFDRTTIGRICAM